MQVFWTGWARQHAERLGHRDPLRLSTSRATFVLKFGAVTQISTVCPARNTRWRRLSDAMIVAAPLRTLPALSVLVANVHFGLPCR